MRQWDQINVFITISTYSNFWHDYISQFIIKCVNGHKCSYWRTINTWVNESYSKTLLVVGAAAVLVIGTFVSVLNSVAFAQANNTGSNASSIGSQKILVKSNPISFTGTIPLRSTINKAIASIIKIPLIEAVSAAQKLVGSNSSATLAILRPLIGYLVYDVHVRNNSNSTSYPVIIDPGNGQVLYHQALTSFSMVGHPSILAKGGFGGFYAGK